MNISQLNAHGNGNIRSFLRTMAFLMLIAIIFMVPAAILIAIDTTTGRIGELPSIDLSDPGYFSPAEMAWEPEPYVGPELGSDPQFVYGPPGDPAEVGPMPEEVSPAERAVYEAILAGTGQDA